MCENKRLYNYNRLRNLWSRRLSWTHTAKNGHIKAKSPDSPLNARSLIAPILRNAFILIKIAKPFVLYGRGNYVAESNV